MENYATVDNPVLKYKNSLFSLRIKSKLGW